MEKEIKELNKFKLQSAQRLKGTTFEKQYKSFYAALSAALKLQHNVSEHEYSANTLHLHLLSERYVTYVNAVQDIAQRGETIQQVGDKGQIREVPNPYSHVRDKAYKDIVDGIKECALTIRSSRSLKAQDTTQDSMSSLFALLQNPDTEDA